MDLNAYNTTIDLFEKNLEKLNKAQFLVRGPPFFLDDNRTLSVDDEHRHVTPAELDENLAILQQYVAALETDVADRKREKETISGVLAQLKSERAKLEPPNGKREAPAAEADNDPKKPKTVPTVVAPVKK